MASSLVHCIYTSSQAHPMAHTEIDALLKHSRENNTRHGITGILFCVGGSFMQVLEGDSRKVDELYAKILMDARHTRITRIILEAVPHRFFGEWTMALATIGAEELAEILGDSDVHKHEALLSSIDEGRAKKLLRAFSAGRWRQSMPADVKGSVV